MKPTVLIAISTAIAGFALGWLLKPAGQAELQPATGTEVSRQATGGKSHDRKENLVLKPRGKVNPEAIEADPEKAASRITSRRNIEGARERAFSARLSRFTEALGLSQEQKDAMEALAAGRAAGA